MVVDVKHEVATKVPSREFTNIVWTDETARVAWGPRIERIKAAWGKVEWRAILDGVRQCCLGVYSPAQVPERSSEFIEHGLFVLPIQLDGASPTYGNAASRPQKGSPFQYRMAIGSLTDIVAFKAAWDRRDDDCVGAMLGYPRCCREFFQRVWVAAGLRDTTWSMAERSADATPDSSTLVVSGAVEANILWRWMGVRAVPHLPCSFRCEATVEFGQRLAECARRSGYEKELEWMYELLNAPVEWSALNGVATIKTPFLEVTTSTDAVATTRSIRRAGVHNRVRTPPICSTPAAAVPEEAAVEGDVGWQYRDNGFASMQSMGEAHAPVLAAVRSTLSIGVPASVLDLGCGNGALLKSVLSIRSDSSLYGIDVDAHKIVRARTLQPDNGTFLIGSMFENDELWREGQRYGIALVMPGRFLEVDSWDAAWLRARVQRQCDHIVMYAYGEWLVRYGSLEGLVAAAGFDLGLKVEGGSEHAIVLAARS